MKLHSWFMVAILASLLLFAACDDDDDNGDTNGDSSPTTTAVVDGEPTIDDDGGDGGETAAGFDTFSAFAGTWVGSWTNNNFDTTAELTITITVNEDGTANFSLELTSSDTGAPFGSLPPDVKTFDGTYDENGLTVSVQDDFLGNLAVTITSDGVLSAESTEIPALGSGSSFTVEGTLGSNSADLMYTLTFPDGSTNPGTVMLSKQVRD